MILDASVLVALALDEPDRPALVAKINAAPAVGVGSPTLVEAGIVLSSRRGMTASGLVELVAFADATVVAFGDAHWHEALSAWARFGKARHPARLNFGDCLTYAVASLAGEPLLALGNDFARTDLELA